MITVPHADIFDDADPFSVATIARDSAMIRAAQGETTNLDLPRRSRDMGPSEALEPLPHDAHALISAEPRDSANRRITRQRRKTRKGIRLRLPSQSNARTGNDAARAFYRFGQRWGLRYMNDAQRAGLPLPDAETLAEGIYAEIMNRAGDRVDGWDGLRTKRRPHASQVVQASENAARFVLDTWDPGYTARQARRGAAGGRKSRRGPSVPLDAVRDTAGHTRAEAAQILGVSQRTVSRLWARLDADS